MSRIDRENAVVRRFDFEIRSAELNAENPQEMIVEGYAVRFNSPTVLFEFEGVEYFEEIAADAFADTRMSDVIFNYNHGGKVLARTRNNTLELLVDEKGLFIRAHLEGTAEGRALYEEIKGGYIDRMSFKFTIAEEEYDEISRKWTIKKVKRLYDVSAVDIPAYDDTSISARKEFLEADAQKRIAHENAVAALERARLELKTKF